MSSTVIVRRDEDGWIDYTVVGDDVRLFIVDETTPHDRVFEWLRREPQEAADAILGDSPIGSNQDERHAAVAHRIISQIEGRPRLSVVEDDE